MKEAQNKEKGFETLSTIKLVPILMIAAIALVVVSVQYFHHAMILGTDSNFHIQRIYDTAKQIQTGNWSYFQANYGFQQSGRIVNAVYGPLAAYIAGGLLLLVGSWQRFEIVSSFILLFLSGTGLYLFSRNAGANKKISTIVGISYMCSGGYSSSWLTGQKFASWGAMLVPFVLICGLTMIKDKKNPIHALTLGTSVALLIQVHMLTSIFVILGLVPFFLVGFLRTSQKGKMLFDLLGAMFLCLLLTANVWGAYLDLLHAQSLQAPFVVNDLGLGTLHFSFGESYLRQTGAIRFVLYFSQILYVLFQWKRTSLTNHTLTVGGTIFLLISSNFFPWKNIGEHVDMLRSFLQFPSRIEVIATVLLLAGISLSITEVKTDEVINNTMILTLLSVASLVLVLQLMNTITILSNRWNSNSPVQEPNNVVITKRVTAKEIRDVFRSKNIDEATKMMAKGAVDYLPAPTKYRTTDGKIKMNSKEPAPYEDYISQIVDNKLSVKKYVNGSRLITKWKAKDAGVVQIPIFAYRHTRIVLNGRVINIKNKVGRTNIGALVVKGRKGMNTISIQYVPGKSFKILLLISLITWGFLILYLIWNVIKGFRLIN